MFNRNTCPVARCEGEDGCVFSHAAAGIAVLNGHGAFLWANQLFCNMFGYTLEEILRQAVSLILPEDARDMARLYYEHLGQYGVKESVEWKLRRKDGAIFDAQVSTSVIHDDSGRTISISLFNDITQRKRIERELNDKERYNRLLFQESPVGISLTDKAGRFRQVNAQYLKMVGYSADELFGIRYQDLSAPEYEEEDITRGKELRTTGRIENYEKELIRKDGTRLSVALNVVSIELNDEELYLCSAVDISAIIQARRQAEAANQAKDAFLSNMSHEMRTPLNGIMGVAQLVSQGELNAAQRSLLDTMFHCGEALEAMIDDLLDLSNLYTGVLKLKSESFNLEEAVYRLIHLFRPEAENKGLDLVVHYPTDGPVHFIGDGGRIRQMLAHLVDNALKFTTTGYVSVEIHFDNIEQDPIWTRIRVKDSGLGMSEEQQLLLNSLLSQVDMLPSRKQGGIGLGLSLCRELARVMGGVLYMDSRPNEGTEFTITLPLQTDPAAPPRQIKETPWRAKPMVIVSASPHMRDMLGALARHWQFEADICHTGEEVLALLKQANAMERPYWLVLADSRIADMPVGTLISEIVSMGRGLPLQMAVICGPREIEEVHAPHEHDIGAFLVRPVSPSSLYDALLSLWQSSEVAVSNVAPLTEASTAPLVMRQGKRRPHVLIVEDNAANQLVAQGFLERLQCRWDIADNGVSAVDKIRQNHYDLVLMDIQMPGMDGLEATHAIRALEEGGQVPIVAMTANALRDDRDQCIAAGMNDYISKPVHFDALQTIMERYCAHMLDDAQSNHGEMRALILEPDPSLRKKLAATLRDKHPGIAVMEAEDAVEGCVGIGSFAPSVIVFDPDMQGLDSETMVRFLLRIPRYARTMLIAWTVAENSPGENDYLKRQGVQVLPCKPSIDPVLAVIKGESFPCEISHKIKDDLPLPDDPPKKAPLLFSLETALSVTGGNLELLKRIISLIAEDLPRQMALLKEALETKDAKAARLAAHSIKGQAANMGAQALREVAYQAEQAAASGDLDGAAALAGDIELQSAMLIEQLLNMDWE